MEQRFGRRGLSIDPMGRFPGEISPAREIYIYIERRVSWAEIEWLRGKTRTGKSYALWFAVHSPLLALHRQPNNITCCTGPRDPSSVQTSSRAQNYRAPLAPHARNVPSEGWSGRPPRLMNFIYLGRASLARGRDHEQFLLESFMMDLPAMADHLCADCFRILWDSGDLFDRRREREDREICIKGFWRCLISDLWGWNCFIFCRYIRWLWRG